MTLCIQIEWLSSQFELFDVSFPEKLLKIVATRGEIFSLKFAKCHLAAKLHPDPLGELKRSPDPLAATRGLLRRGGEGKGGEGRSDGKGGKGRRERRGREVVHNFRNTTPPLIRWLFLGAIYKMRSAKMRKCEIGQRIKCEID